MKVYVDKMPREKSECLFNRGARNVGAFGVEHVCFFREGKSGYLGDEYCLGIDSCPYLKVYEEPESVNEYPSYFTPCC